MATRQQLDAALESEKKEIQQAAERHEQSLKDQIEKAQDAINNLQSKVGSGDDFASELNEVNSHIETLRGLAASPIAVVTGQQSSTGGAAGTVVGGAAANAQAEAAGGKVADDQGDHPGNVPMPHEPDAPAKEEGEEAEEEPQPKASAQSAESEEEANQQ